MDVVEAARFPERVLRYRNQRWARRVGLDALDAEGWLDHFGSFEPLPDNLESPLALRYHGHQFQSYNPDLGDGRGFLFAQLRDVEDDRLLDLGTKGSGQTPWSRGGDGRLTLKGGVREVLATELLEALGVYTSRTFSLIETGEQLVRGDEPSPTRSSVMVRLSHSHIRFGSFQRQAFLKRPENVRKLLDFSVAQYYPELLGLEGEARCEAFLQQVVEVSARLAASWMVAGFVHGVLNTDNMNITGESFDYGPYRFLPVLDPRFTAAYFDSTGLYAYGRQPEVMGWNLARLAETLLPLCDRERLVAVLEGYGPLYTRSLCARTLERLGIRPKVEGAEPGGEAEVRAVEILYRYLEKSRVGFERFFFDWYGGLESESRALGSPDAAKYRAPEFAEVREQLAGYRAAHPERLESAYFAGEGPCTLLIEEIESLWEGIAERDDWSDFEAKLEAIARMREALEPSAPR